MATPSFKKSAEILLKRFNQKLEIMTSYNFLEAVPVI